MFKSVIATLATASALFLGCGVAHADDVDDAITAVAADYPEYPALANHLHYVRSIRPALTVEGVYTDGFFVTFYCTWPAAVGLTGPAKTNFRLSMEALYRQDVSAADADAVIARWHTFCP